MKIECYYSYPRPCASRSYLSFNGESDLNYAAARRGAARRGARLALISARISASGQACDRIALSRSNWPGYRIKFRDRKSSTWASRYLCLDLQSRGEGKKGRRTERGGSYWPRYTTTRRDATIKVLERPERLTRWLTRVCTRSPNPADRQLTFAVQIELKRDRARAVHAANIPPRKDLSKNCKRSVSRT